MKESVRIAAAQGFYGDSPMAAMQVVSEGAADYLVSDALAELTLSILQKDRLRDENMGYARDIEFLAKTLYPAALAQGMKIVTNSGGLNPLGAVKKVSAILEKQGITDVKIAAITGDNMIDRLEELQNGGEKLLHLDSQVPYSDSKYPATHANVYTGAASVKDALDQGAQIILAGRVADPCLTLGILAHEFNWEIENATSEQLDLLATGICVGHLLECGGQASGGNSYAQWPMDYPIDALGYPIAQVFPDGKAIFSKLDSAGGLLSRDSLREQLIYEIHDPENYLTPDVTVDLSKVKLETLAKNKVQLSGVKGKPRPEKLKLSMGQNEGFISEQFFYFS
ncbi:MAG: acyclic terpene utilization AtuA family protein, partial [Chitinophagales bacterium]